MLAFLPVLLPLVTALVTAGLFRAPRAQVVSSIVGGVLLLLGDALLLMTVVDSGPIALGVGGWAAPYGIQIVADELSTVLLLVSASLGLCALIAELGAGEHQEKEGREMRHSLLHGLLAAVGGALLAGDLFNLYVWFELMLIVVLGLLVQGGEKRHLEAAFKYLVVSMLGTLLFLAAIAFLYGTTGQLNFAALAESTRSAGAGDARTIFVVMLGLAFLLKAGAFPLFFWLPASYHTLSAPQLALVGGLVTKVAVYVLLRLVGQVFVSQPAFLYESLGWIAVLTMVSGVLGAAYHWDLRRILSFHIVSQIGYLLLAVALASPAAARAGVFFLVHNMLAKSALFFIAGIVSRSAGHSDLRRIGGLYAARPGLAMLFLVAAFSLVGLPPSSGFWSKFLLVQEAFAQGRFVWGGVALAVGGLTLYSMVKIWLEAFWKSHPGDMPRVTDDARLRSSFAAVMALVAVLVFLALYPEPLIELLTFAVEERFGRGT